MSKLVTKMNKVLADSYALYLKTQNFHWNVESHHAFRSLHLLFEEQYEDLAEAVDEIAEKIRQLGSKAPGSFSAFQQLTSIEEGDINSSADQMLKALAKDQDTIIQSLNDGIQEANEVNDEGMADLLIERLRVHSKNKWMLESSF